MSVVTLLVNLVRSFLMGSQQLALENLALRQQLAVYQRTVPRPAIQNRDRVFWLIAMRLLDSWKDALVLVRPETVVAWHRKGFRHYWRQKSMPKQGRPVISPQLVHLIRRLSEENALWGAPRIQSELALLGHELAISTVAKYMAKTRRDGPSQTWRTFLANHMDVTAACDLFVVPTWKFKLLYVFVVLSHDRRRILHFNVTSNPTAAWTARQLIEAFPYDSAPRYLLRDRDKIYGWAFKRCVEALGIESVVTAARSPWQNAYVERVIGTLRRECTDHIIPLGERHLRRLLGEYVAYYNESRAHLSLEGNAPQPRAVESEGEVVAAPVLGGLHHRYSRRAA